MITRMTNSSLLKYYKRKKRPWLNRHCNCIRISYGLPVVKEITLLKWDSFLSCKGSDNDVFLEKIMKHTHKFVS